MKKGKLNLCRKLSLILFAMFMASSIWAQQNVRGKVVDSDGQPLPGVSVVLQGTTIGTVTDPEGSYAISVPPDGSLQFSFIGMLDIVMDERRLELTWEGHRVNDVFRNNRTLDRTYFPEDVEWHGPRTIPPTSDRIVHFIPESEIILNPNLEQNP